MNLLDSHDTARYLSIARGDQDSVRLGMLLLMTFPGAPSVYYGDEICIRGSDDPEAPLDDSEARWAFPWAQPETWDREMLAYFKEVIALRHAHPALRRGAYRALYAEGGVYVFARQDAQETVLVAVNVGTEGYTITLPMEDLLNEYAQPQLLFGNCVVEHHDGSQLMLMIAARSGVVLQV